MPSTFQFTATQLAEITRLRQELSANLNKATPSGAVPLYSYLFKCVTGMDLSAASTGAISLV